MRRFALTMIDLLRQAILFCALLSNPTIRFAPMARWPGHERGINNFPYLRTRIPNDLKKS